MCRIDVYAVCEFELVPFTYHNNMTIPCLGWFIVEIFCYEWGAAVSIPQFGSIWTTTRRKARMHRDGRRDEWDKFLLFVSHIPIGPQARKYCRKFDGYGLSSNHKQSEFLCMWDCIFNFNTIFG